MKNKFGKSLVILAVGGLMIAGSASAQNSSGAGPGVVDPGHPRVNQVNRREANQQKAHWERRRQRKINFEAGDPSRKTRDRRPEPRKERHGEEQRSPDKGRAARHQPPAEPHQPQHREG